jgi:hypothetical protein
MNRRRRDPARAVALALGIALLAAGCGPKAAPAEARTVVGGNAFVTPLSGAPRLAGNSTALVHRLASGGPMIANLYQYGTPVFDADATSPRRAVRCTEPWGTCDLEKAPVPIPDAARPAPGTDAAMVVVDHATDSAYEFWQAKRAGDGSWTAGWGSRTRLSGDGRRGETGAGTSLLAGLVRTDEIRTGRIDHAIRVSSAYTCRTGVVYPAVKTDGRDTRRDCLPMGTRLQLDPALNLAQLPGLSPAERAVGAAMQRYGAYVLNTSGTPLSVAFEEPTRSPDPYPAAGLPHDYAAMAGIPLARLRVVAAP